MREKLIELLKEGHKQFLFIDQIADHLIANGVTVREKGEWIPQDNTYTRYTCSVCNTRNHRGGDRFCSLCGADMRGAEHER